MMKNLITFLMCVLCILPAIAQSESNDNQLVIPERTPALNALYQEAKQLENRGTAAEINANRLAIKNAWQEVDPAIAALYRPVAPASVPAVAEGSYEESRSPEDWDTDNLLRAGLIDGVDMDVTGDGHIYIAAFEIYVGSGLDDTNLYVYRSTDDGNSFTLWKSIIMYDVTIEKMQTISIDGNGDEYLLAYMNSDVSLYLVRINMATGDFDLNGIANDVTDFSMDRDWPGNTDATRVYGIYTKEGASPKIYSARTTAGSYGFDWVDEIDIPGANLGSPAFAYGRLGACYTAYIGLGSGNLYARPNLDYNDPASWGGAAEYVTDGSLLETRNPTIRAARKVPSSDEVLIIASSRNAGTTDHFDASAFRRENSGAFTPITFGTTGSDNNMARMNSWIRREADVETIQISYVVERIDGSVNNINVSALYDGNGFNSFEPVADNDIDVFEGFPSAIAETRDNLPCMAFTGTDSGGMYGADLYFDRKSTLGVEEHSLQDFTFYPNPVRATLNISAKGNVDNVSIYSLLGQKVMEVSPNQKSPSLNVSSLASGIYVMNVEVDGQTATYKIVKN